MAAALTRGLSEADRQIEILDLRHFSAKQLRSLLEEEARVWVARLNWDYRSSTELLLQYLDSRVLPGFVALDNGNVCGYTFCVYEGQKAIIGDAYAANGAVGTVHHMLRHLLEMLTASPDLDRIESQLLLYDAGTLSQPFIENGFQLYPRLFMEGLLATVEPEPAMHLPEGLTLQQWSTALYQPAGELIHVAYREHLDAGINDQYRTLHGSLRFLHNIVRFPGCGVFDAEASWVLRETATGALKGMVLCSRVREDVGHITQLCIVPELRQKGLGRMLLRHAAVNLKERNFRALSLTVTEANRSAVRLYQEMGFGVRHRFEAMVWERPQEQPYSS